jgi:hypothetical protein
MPKNPPRHLPKLDLDGISGNLVRRLGSPLHGAKVYQEVLFLLYPTNQHDGITAMPRISGIGINENHLYEWTLLERLEFEFKDPRFSCSNDKVALFVTIEIDRSIFCFVNFGDDKRFAAFIGYSIDQIKDGTRFYGAQLELSGFDFDLRRRSFVDYSFDGNHNILLLGYVGGHQHSFSKETRPVCGFVNDSQYCFFLGFQCVLSKHGVSASSGTAYIFDDNVTISDIFQMYFRCSRKPLIDVSKIENGSIHIDL